MREREFLEQNQERHQATGFHVQGIGKRNHTTEGKNGLGDTFGMGNMKGASEGNWILITHCLVARFGVLHSIHMALA